MLSAHAAILLLSATVGSETAYRPVAIPPDCADLHLTVPDDVRVEIRVERKCKDDVRHDFSGSRRRHFRIRGLKANEPYRVQIIATRLPQSGDGCQPSLAPRYIQVMAGSPRFYTIYPEEMEVSQTAEEKKPSYVFLSNAAVKKPSANQILFDSTAQLTATIEKDDDEGRLRFRQVTDDHPENLEAFRLIHKFTYSPDYLPDEGTDECKGELVLILKWDGEKEGEKRSHTIEEDVDVEFEYDGKQGTLTKDSLDNIRGALMEIDEDFRNEFLLADEPSEVYVHCIVKFKDAPAIPVQGRVTIRIVE